MYYPTMQLAIRVAMLVMITSLVGCSAEPRIVTNRDPGADFASFQTFDFMQPLSSDRGEIRSLISAHLIAATTRELERSGLQQVDADADLLVNFFVSTRDMISARSTPSSSITMHHGRSRYRTWSGYSFSASTTQVVQTTQGTIAVDIIDARRNQIVWEGAATAVVTDRNRSHLQQTVDGAIARMFAFFP